MKLVVLDRDGVINAESDAFIKAPDEWKAIPGSLEGIARLNQRGFRVVVATNQSGIGRGLLDMPAFNAINDKMLRALAQVGGRIDAIFYCPHLPDSGCACRKPRPGMLHEIGRRFSVDLANLPCLGDSLRDLEAAHAVGALPILVATGRGRATSIDPALPPETLAFDDLAAAARHLAP